MDKKDSGGLAFGVMIVIIAFLFVVCIVLPLSIPTFSKEAYALPLMIVGLALPFVYFFIFGGVALARKKREDKALKE